ncbi:hypothetical protein FEV09_20320 [Pseudanabaena catenata USMAC16]|uniref:Uncharacterized protein n=2 Tax=Pseudanabaena TaxID=1152 RepID=L8MVP1_9CYAN|nr:hypothetical protein [Pseudanabaena catenata]ELS30849.1 hypothetical protein Pse7429DRAFT_4073 [Pseudanabaena biceps PCC 7429]MDG3496888.1 hypothetical protein [Pseudanabaena catenata USMAC16]
MSKLRYSNHSYQALLPNQEFIPIQNTNSEKVMLFLKSKALLQMHFTALIPVILKKNGTNLEFLWGR